MEYPDGSLLVHLIGTEFSYAENLTGNPGVQKTPSAQGVVNEMWDDPKSQITEETDTKR